MTAAKKTHRKENWMHFVKHLKKIAQRSELTKKTKTKNMRDDATTDFPKRIGMLDIECENKTRKGNSCSRNELATENHRSGF